MGDTQLSQNIALVTGAFLSGAMMTISLIAVPTYVGNFSSSVQLCHMWVDTFYYGHRAMPGLAIATFLLYLSIAYRQKRAWMAYTGLVTVLMVPFTWIFMFPTNDELFALDDKATASAVGKAAVELVDVQGLVERWSALHLTRSFFPLIGAIMGVYALQMQRSKQRTS